MRRERAIALLALGEKALDVHEKSSQVWTGYQAVKEAIPDGSNGTSKMVTAMFTGIMGVICAPMFFKKG